MTDNKALFSTYVPTKTRLTVKIADASTSIVTGIGNIKVTHSLTLNGVLHVPNLKCNLLSVSQLAQDKRCHAKFFATHCFFQDLFMGMTIGVAKECEELYYLNNCVTRIIQSCKAVSPSD